MENLFIMSNYIYILHAYNDKKLNTTYLDDLIFTPLLPDFGMMGEFKQELRDGFIEACLHLVNRDFDALAKDFVTLGYRGPVASLYSFSVKDNSFNARLFWGGIFLVFIGFFHQLQIDKQSHRR